MQAVEQDSAEQQAGLPSPGPSTNGHVNDDGEGRLPASGLARDSTSSLEEVESGVPVLHTHAQQGDVEQIRALLESGAADASDRDAEGITALHWAAMNMHVSACRELLDKGAEVDAIGGQLNSTPLHWAARYGSRD